MLTDPGTRRIVAALKSWETATTTEAVPYEADAMTRYRANAPAPPRQASRTSSGSTTRSESCP